MATQPRTQEIRTQHLFFYLLKPDGSNYIGWNIDMQIYLCIEELDATFELSLKEVIPPP